MRFIHVFDELIVEVFNFLNEVLRVLPVSVLELDQLILHLFRVKLHILEQLLVYVESLESVVHFGGQDIVLILDFLLKQPAVSIEA